jgi:L-amino acid N-acyltransferase YncA
MSAGRPLAHAGRRSYARRFQHGLEALRQWESVTTADSSSPSGFDEQTLRLSFPEAGLRIDNLVLRLPNSEDVQGLIRAFATGELSEADNISPFSRNELATGCPYHPALVAGGQLAPLVVADAESGVLFGGGTLHHLDPARSLIEIGYWLYPEARGRGIATRVARALAEYSFALGIQRVAAYVTVANLESERVLERARFTREGVIRSLPTSGGRRVDKTIFSLLPGE